MAKQFAGFTPQQTVQLLQKMGYTGPADTTAMDQFINSNPAAAAKMGKYTQAAQRMIDTVPAAKAMPPATIPRAMATGGAVTDPTANDKEQQAALKEGQQDLMVGAYTDPASVVPQAEAATVKTDDTQLVPTTAGQLTTPVPSVTPTTVATTATATEQEPAKAVTFEATTSADQVKAETDKLQAATATPTDKATVQGQLASLTAELEQGKVPAWAAGALRNATATMAQRGLGASSMAGAAATQAAIEAAVPIAMQDAQTFAQFEMANLNNQQQVALTKTQTMVQSIFTDQAAQNVAKQINAASENQVKQFYDSMATQVKQFNASQQNAMVQFNTDQENAIKKFNADIVNQRDMFEAGNTLAIATSNAQWRQSVATTNAAAQQQANMQNALAASNMTEQALAALWQRERDIMAFAFQSGESAADRALEVSIAKLTGKQQAKLQDSIGKGQLAGSLFNALIGKWF